LCIVVFYPLSRLLGRRRFEGLEHIPEIGPVLVACNHISYLDPLYTAVFVHRRGRIPRFLAKQDLFRLPVVGRVMTAAGQIPVRRGSAEAGDSLRHAQQALAAGKAVLIYPEGTITRDPALWPMTGKTGAARIALMTGCPVIPVANWGAHEVIPPYQHSFRLLPRKTMRVAAGKPVDLSRFEGQPITADLLQQATTVIMNAVAAELGRLRGQTPPGELYDLRKHRAAERLEQDGPGTVGDDGEMR
jgi:1-acyl-sn-glycerol-3-phosphate acyltransferase